MREWLTFASSLQGPQLHLGVLAAAALAATITMLGALWLVLRGSEGGRLVRALALMAIAITGLAFDRAYGQRPPLTGDLDAFLPALWAFITIAAALSAATIETTRSALWLASVHGMSAIGLLVYVVLLAAVPGSSPVDWEIRRLIAFGSQLASGFLLLLGASYLSCGRTWVITRWAYLLTALGGISVVVWALASHPVPDVSNSLPAVAVLAMLGAGALWYGPIQRRTSARTWMSRLARLATQYPWSPSAVSIGITLGLAGLALVFGGSGSARDESRIAVGGVAWTPGLLVPFAFAVSLAVVVGRVQDRLAAARAVLFTFVLSGLLLAQKEVGNTVITLLIAAATLLVVRGTWLHVFTAGVIGSLALGLAYHLAPFFDFIPFTVRERIHLWLGGADMLQRGGHLVAARFVTFDVGGFWGIGIHQTPGLNLGRSIAALDTDFPLAIAGLYGGVVLLGIYIAHFTAFGLLQLHTVRCLRFGTDTKRARFQAGLLTALGCIPICSTVLNLAGAVTQLTPFTGVPVAFVSFGFTFLLGAFVIVAQALVVGDGTVLRARLRREAEHELRTASVDVHGVRLGKQRKDAPPDPRPARAPEPQPASPEPKPRRLARRNRSAHARGIRALRRGLRFQRFDAGLLLLTAALLASSTAFTIRLLEQYTDTALYLGHPRAYNSLRIEPVAGTLTFKVVEGPAGTKIGPLESGERLRLDSLWLEYKERQLLLRGACFDRDHFRLGVRIGSLGLLDAPKLPGVDRIVDPLVTVIHHPDSNDVVIPLGDIALREVIVRSTDDDHFVVEPASPASRFRLVDAEGSDRSSLEPLTWGEGFVLGQDPERPFVFTADGGDVCLEARGSALERFVLAFDGPTVLGNMSVRRLEVATRTVDVDFAIRVKEAAEAGIITAGSPQGPLEVIPHDPTARAEWDPTTRNLFNAVFQIDRLREPDGSVREVLAWRRPFYGDGSRTFRGDRDLDAWLIDGTRVLGLRDTYQFSRRLAQSSHLQEPERRGRLLDRRGRVVTEELAFGQTVNQLPGAGPLVGFSFEAQGIRDGLLRIFNGVLQGTQPQPNVWGEFSDLVEGRFRGPWGMDIELTIDADMQALLFEVLDDEVAALDRAEPSDVHRAQAVILGEGNELLAIAQLPDIGPILNVDSAVALKDLQARRPMSAPALDAFHRRTTMGSAAKILTTIVAFEDKTGVLIEDRNGMFQIDATGDAANGRSGFFGDSGGVLRSYRGRPIVPIHNYHGQSFGRTISMQDMVAHSVNTAASYLGLNVGRERFLEFIGTLRLDTAQDLLPAELNESPEFAFLIDRYARDSARTVPSQIGHIPANEVWTDSYTARLPLSGTSDYTILALSAGVSIVARNGTYHPPVLVRGVRKRKTGEYRSLAPPPAIPILAPEDAQTILKYMHETIRAGTATYFRRGMEAAMWEHTAGKTGTGETVIPVDRGDVYDRVRKPKTRDNKIFVAIWPTDRPQPYTIAVIFEQASHLDGRVALRAVRRIVEGLAILEDEADERLPTP